MSYYIKFITIVIVLFLFTPWIVLNIFALKHLRFSPKRIYADGLWLLLWNAVLCFFFVRGYVVTTADPEMLRPPMIFLPYFAWPFTFVSFFALGRFFDKEKKWYNLLNIVLGTAFLGMIIIELGLYRIGEHLDVDYIQSGIIGPSLFILVGLGMFVARVKGIKTIPMQSNSKKGISGKLYDVSTVGLGLAFFSMGAMAMGTFGEVVWIENFQGLFGCGAILGFAIVFLGAKESERAKK